MFLLNEEHLDKLYRLFDKKIDNDYVILSSNAVFTDIAQYCEKYQNVKFITVPTDRLLKH